MGLLEYQAMSSLRDVAHDSGFVHLLYNSSMKIHQLAARQLRLGQPIRYGKGGRNGPSITYKITPAGPLSSSQPGGPPFWASPLAFGLIGIDSQKLNPTNQKNNQDGYRNRTGFLTFFQLGAWIM
jgi:hypothetical protein